MAPSQGTQHQQPFLAIHSADEHSMIYIPFQISLLTPHFTLSFLVVG
jgi:hypothetical protein